MKSQSKMQIWLLIIEGTQNNQKEGLKWEVEKGLLNEKLTFIAGDKRRPPGCVPCRPYSSARGSQLARNTLQYITDPQRQGRPMGMGGSQVQGSNLPSSYVTLSKSPYLSEPPFHQGHNEDRDSPPGLWQRRTNKAYGSISYRPTHMAQCKRSVPIWVTAELKKDYTPLLKPHLGPSESESLGVGLPR